MTKIVDRDELGKAVSMMTAIDTLAPMLINPILVLIFTHTLDKYPGTVFQVIALMALIPILICIWIDIFTERPLDEAMDSNDNNHNLDANKKDLEHSLFKKNAINRFESKIESPVKLLTWKKIHCVN